MAAAKMGRPTVFTPDVKDLVLEYIEAGASNSDACNMVGVEPSSLYATLNRDPEFAERYVQAKAGAVEAMVDDAEQAAQQARTAQNGNEVAGAKVFIDFKKWQAARLAPNRWGEKAQVHVTGQISTDDQDMAKRVAFLEAMKEHEDAKGAEDDFDASEFV